jgi:calmodulin
MTAKSSASPELHEIFRLVDRDGQGSISRDELMELMSMLNIDVSAEEVGEMIREMDSDGNDEIDFDEFAVVMAKKVSASSSAEKVKAAFKSFEGRKNGFVSVDELVLALTSYGSTKLSMDEAMKLVSTLESDTSGNINYIDYIDMM